jgi:CHAD domain-containing protein
VHRGDSRDPIWLRHTTEDLRWIGTVLGRVRDADVLSKHLRRHDPAPTGADNVIDRLTERLDAERNRAAVELSADLTSHRYLDLVDKLHAGIGAAPFLRGAPARPDGGLWEPKSRSAAALPALVQARWRKFTRTAQKGGAHASAEELHQMRIAAKRLRYAAEAAVPVNGKPARRTARAAERVQTLLGQFHDEVAAEQWLRATLDDSNMTLQAAFEAGALSRDQQLRQRQQRRNWRLERKKTTQPQKRLLVVDRAINIDFLPEPDRQLLEHRSAGLDVIDERPLVVLEGIDPMLDDVTDAHDADQLPGLHDGQVSDAVGSHDRHQGLHLVPRVRAANFLDHDVGHGPVEHGGPPLG